jgi:hypothetical protein
MQIPFKLVAAPHRGIIFLQTIPPPPLPPPSPRPQPTSNRTLSQSPIFAPLLSVTLGRRRVSLCVEYKHQGVSCPVLAVDCSSHVYITFSPVPVWCLDCSSLVYIIFSLVFVWCLDCSYIPCLYYVRYSSYPVSLHVDSSSHVSTIFSPLPIWCYSCRLILP